MLAGKAEGRTIKTCTKCGEAKPKSEFSKNARAITRVFAVTLAKECEGRTISLGFHVRLTPPAAPLGEPDAGIDIGHGLISETMRYLKQAAEREGFDVEITATNVVY